MHDLKESNGNGGPLTGIRVFEVGHILAAPYACMMLADLGADVIKIEPSSGDLARQVGPNYIGRHNTYFASLNRNKRSVTLDLATTQGQAQLGELAHTAHALITNLRPSAIKKLGLTYQELRKWNDQIVCVALTGYGLEGPYADHPAYDYIIQALIGMMYLTGDPDAAPTRVGYSVVDNNAGTTAALGLLAKIIEGKGGQLDISLYDTMLSQMNYVASAYLNGKEVPQRQVMSAHPYFVPAQLFRTRDGWVALFISHDRFWRTFSSKVGRSEWADDPRFATMKARRQNRELVVELVSEVFLTDDTENWVRELMAQGIVISPVNTLPVALEGDIAQQRDMIVSIESEDGPIVATGNPIKIQGWRPKYQRPPLLGEHNVDLLPGKESP